MKGQLEKNNIDIKEVNLISLLIVVFFFDRHRQTGGTS
jgi:hypothetical protein